MLTTRTLLLAATGLLVGYVAAAQPATPTAPDGPDFLLGLIIALLGLVAVAVMLTALTVATQIKHRRHYVANAPSNTTMGAEREAPLC
jgi:hypothetical protein